MRQCVTMDCSYFVNLLRVLLFLGSLRVSLVSPHVTTCSADVIHYSERLSNQSQLDRFLDSIISRRRNSGCHSSPRHIQLSLTANSYQLNITKFVLGVDLKGNDSLKVEGEGERVYICCTGVDGVHASNLYLSKASMVVFDGLVFTRCLRPIYVEEVNTVVIQNCVFQ